jgi:hypothetical protein
MRDHGQKLEDYRRLPSLKEILLVASNERRVQHWRRDGTRWVVDDLIGDADLRLDTVPQHIPLAAIYQGSGVGTASSLVGGARQVQDGSVARAGGGTVRGGWCSWWIKFPYRARLDSLSSDPRSSPANGALLGSRIQTNPRNLQISMT